MSLIKQKVKWGTELQRMIGQHKHWTWGDLDFQLHTLHGERPANVSNYQSPDYPPANNDGKRVRETGVRPSGLWKSPPVSVIILLGYTVWVWGWGRKSHRPPARPPGPLFHLIPGTPTGTNQFTDVGRVEHRERTNVHRDSNRAGRNNRLQTTKTSGRQKDTRLGRSGPVEMTTVVKKFIRLLQIMLQVTVVVQSTAGTTTVVTVPKYHWTTASLHRSVSDPPAVVVCHSPRHGAFYETHELQPLQDPFWQADDLPGPNYSGRCVATGPLPAP
ncbi:unnamed protein product [Calypogeia fissa]